jgi:hypothetical protein
VSNLLDAGQDVDPTVLLNMVANASGAEELDSEEVDGEPMAGVAADVRLTEMLEAQGMDTEAVLDRLESQPGAPFDVREVMLGFAVPMEVRIDADGHVRRLTQDVGEALSDLADEVGEDPSQLGILNTVVTIDFDDHGDPSIEVPVPDPAETVDITDAFQAVDISSGGDG